MKNDATNIKQIYSNSKLLKQKTMPKNITDIAYDIL